MEAFAYHDDRREVEEVRIVVHKERRVADTYENAWGISLMLKDGGRIGLRMLTVNNDTRLEWSEPDDTEYAGVDTEEPLTALRSWDIKAVRFVDNTRRRRFMHVRELSQNLYNANRELYDISEGGGDYRFWVLQLVQDWQGEGWLEHAVDDYGESASLMDIICNLYLSNGTVRPLELVAGRFPGEETETDGEDEDEGMTMSHVAQSATATESSAAEPPSLSRSPSPAYYGNTEGY